MLVKLGTRDRSWSGLTEVEGRRRSHHFDNSTAIVAGRSGQHEHALPKVQVVEANTLSEIWHPSHETETGLFGATIPEHREERRNQQSAFTHESCRHLRIVALSSDRVVDVEEAAGFNHLR